MRPYLKKSPSQKKAGEGTEFKPQYCKKENWEERKPIDGYRRDYFSLVLRC
jgi:hypothetical protein